MSERNKCNPAWAWSFWFWGSSFCLLFLPLSQSNPIIWHKTEATVFKAPGRLKSTTHSLLLPSSSSLPRTPKPSAQAKARILARISQTLTLELNSVNPVLHENTLESEWSALTVPPGSISWGRKHWIDEKDEVRFQLLPGHKVVLLVPLHPNRKQAPKMR